MENTPRPPHTISLRVLGGPTEIIELTQPCTLRDALRHKLRSMPRSVEYRINGTVASLGGLVRPGEYVEVIVYQERRLPNPLAGLVSLLEKRAKDDETPQQTLERLLAELDQLRGD